MRLSECVFPCAVATRIGLSMPGYDTLDGITAIQNAEFSVKSCVSVREEYKMRLRSLVDALIAQDAPLRDRNICPNKCVAKTLESPTTVECKASSTAKQSRQTVANRLRLRATLPAGKELQVMGDWLLLLRTASVNVIESIVHWRQVVHQDRSVPFEGGPCSGNYLLQMAHDTNFLNQCADLVEWLGFDLTRNPFIVHGGLDNTTSETESHHDRRRQKVAIPPPPSLVKPIVSILPEDDVVDGSRIKAAQNVLKDEEALHGVWVTSESVKAALAKEVLPLAFCHEVPKAHGGQIKGQDQTQTIFEEIGATTKMLKASQHHLMVMQREYNKIVVLSHQLEVQIAATILSKDHDTARDHRVWEYREHCRQTTLRLSKVSHDRLQQRMESLHRNMETAKSIVTKHQQRLHILELTRDELRRQRSEKKQQAQSNLERHGNRIRQKTIARNRGFRAKRARGKPDQSPTNTENHLLPSDDEFERAFPDTYLEHALHYPTKDDDCRVKLEQKRWENIEHRDRDRNERVLLSAAQANERNRQRNERSRMLLEDRLAMAVENRIHHARQMRSLKEDKSRCLAFPIFSTVQPLGGIGGGKKYRLAVFRNGAKGYSPDGLRFVAYDPSSSSSYSMLVSSREYNALGYGRTDEGFAAFCQWLCLTYEKRKRQFQLIWAGAPCPPPLRVCDYDHRLICLHKEGIRVAWDAPSSIASTPPPSYHFVSVYVRANAPSNVHVVLSKDNDGQFTEKEFKIRARRLFPVDSVTWRADVETGNFHLVWLHATEGEVQIEHASSETRIFSGELPLSREKNPTRVHIYDVSRTEYELRITRPRVDSSLDDNYDTAVLLKRQVNPFNIRLPHSAFGELLSCIIIEDTGSDGSSITAVMKPSWKGCLAKYVRAIRMTKFGCKIGSIYCTVVAVLLQQKTEFRAYLVFEVGPVHEPSARYSLRISLSASIRCRDAFWRCLGDSELENNNSLHCVQCMQNRLQTSNPHTPPTVDMRDRDDLPPTCLSCIDAQKARLEILQKLVEQSDLVSEESANFLFYGSCYLCTKPSPPIVIVRPQADAGGWTDNVLHHYFHFFDLEHASHDEHISTSIRATLEDTRICVVETSFPILPTESNIQTILRRVRSVVLLSNHDTSDSMAEIVFMLDELDMRVVNSSVSDGLVTESATCLEALQNLASSIVLVGTIANDLDASQHEDIFNFDAYLVSEALLIEATRILVDRYVQRRPPGETVGASSWDFACEVMRDARQLSLNLHARYHELVLMDDHTRHLLELYESHSKWPKSLDEVRLPFQPLFLCLSHVMYVQRLFAAEVDGFCEKSKGSTGSPSQTLSVYELEKHVSIVRIKRPSFSSGHCGLEKDFSIE